MLQVNSQGLAQSITHRRRDTQLETSDNPLFPLLCQWLLRHLASRSRHFISLKDIKFEVQYLANRMRHFISLVENIKCEVDTFKATYEYVACQQESSVSACGQKCVRV